LNGSTDGSSNIEKIEFGNLSAARLADLESSNSSCENADIGLEKKRKISQRKSRRMSLKSYVVPWLKVGIQLWIAEQLRVVLW
jgi:hypothetical protein